MTKNLTTAPPMLDAVRKGERAGLLALVEHLAVLLDDPEVATYAKANLARQLQAALRRIAELPPPKPAPSGADLARQARAERQAAAIRENGALP